MKIIGLSAKMGCGKSTIAEMLLTMISGAVRISFGDVLKREASQIYGFPLELCYSDAGKKSTVVLDGDKNPMGRDMATVREILQFHGTDYRRKQDPNYWIKQMDAALARMLASNCPCVVVDDVRFKNEAEYLQSVQANLFRIEAYPGWTPGPNAGHASETDLDDWDAWNIVFRPGKGLEHLNAIARNIVNQCN